MAAACNVRRVRASSPSASAAGEPRHPACGQPYEKLSEHELKTLVMITLDERLSDIAANLVLSPKTMSMYRACVLKELQLAKSFGLTVYAIRNRLVGG